MKKKIFGTILCFAIMAVIGISGATATAFAHDTTIKQWGVEHFNKLDVGIYWYTDADNDIPTADYTVKKDAPTIIYTHGWKPSGESACREGMSLKDLGVDALKKKGFPEYEYDEEFYRYYLAQGYNVGVFYWNQLADNEAKPSTASSFMPDFSVDQKIWLSTVNGKNIMRYATYDNENSEIGTISTYDDPNNPDKPVCMIFGDEIIKHLGSDFTGSLQLVGHSMGGQLVLATGEYLCYQYDKKEIGKNLLPDRVTLLDPYFEGFTGIKYDVTVDSTGKTYNYDKNVGAIFTAQFVADATDTIRAHGIPIEGYGVNIGMVVKNYQSLAQTFGFGDERAAIVTEKLKNNCVWVFATGMELYGGFSPTHVMAIDWYFSTNNMKLIKSDEGLYVPSAQMPTEQLQDLIGLTFMQTTPDGVNPLYYDRSSYSLVDFGTNSAYQAGEAKTVVYGKAAGKNSERATYTALLVGEDEKSMETIVDTEGYFYFHNVGAGKYTLKIMSGDKEIGVSEGIIVTDTQTNVKAAVEIKEPVSEGEEMKYLIITLAVLAVVIVLVIVIGVLSDR